MHLTNEWPTDIVVSIGSSGIATADVLGVLLDNVISGTDADRGLPPVVEPRP